MGSAASLNFELGTLSLTNDLLAVTGAVSAGVSGTINVSALSTNTTGIALGDYTLITAASGLNSGFALGSTTITVAGKTYNLSLTHSNSSNEILTVTLASASLPPPSAYWAGTIDGTWSTTQNSGNTTNWRTGVANNIDTQAVPDATPTQCSVPQ